ncbi:MAG: chromosome segregation protein SMC [Phycisphaerae bacterium]|jgi:chromosome segregation protein|nr:chromosome segregation protein SMC [Phycisphaerae bacterium]
MKLKKLIMCGFKSFVDRTEMEFDEGISCIVGPNGCGKSNVVDAMKWVLGEQSAKSLRGTEMLDVIFNGSSARRAAGSAEVTLVFDNSDGVLQPAFSDGSVSDVISVTRRLYRSGQSEYLINKAPCRLRDIREMFMDTGLGKDAYSVIEQGRVEAFLQANQDERRAIFDEAAGISKYKARKKEAIRKLDRAEQNLLRVNDVLNEVEKRLRSIKYQAGKARNYQTYSQELGELKSLYLLAQYHELSNTRTELQGKIDAGNDRVSSIQTRISQLEAAGSATEIESVELERAARELQGQIASMDARITACQERGEMLAQKVVELGQQIVAISARNEELEAKIVACQKGIAESQTNLQTTEEDITRFEAQHQTVRQEHSGGELALANLQTALTEEKASVIDLLRRTSQLNNDIQASTIRSENLTARRDRLAARATELSETLESLQTEQTELRNKVSEARSSVQAGQLRLDKADENSQKLTADEQTLRVRLADTREERSATASRITALTEMQERLEGVSAGVRRVLQAASEGKLPGIDGMLGECIDTDVEHAPVVEAALAGADQWLVAGSFDQLRAHGNRINEIIGQSGAVEIIALDRARPSVCNFDAESSSLVIARAIDWVRFDPLLAPVIRSVLGKTMVVANLDDATSAAAAAGGGDLRFVTLNGEVLEPDGRIRMGAANRSTGVIARKSELAALDETQQQLDASIGALEAQCRDAHDEIKQLDAHRQELRGEINEANTRRVRLEANLAQIDEQVDQALREQPVIAEDIKGIDQDLAAAQARCTQAGEQLAGLQQLSRTKEQESVRLESEIETASQRQGALASRLTEVRVSIASSEQKRLALRESLTGLNRQCEQMKKDLEGGRNEIELIRSRRTDTSQAVQAARDETDKLYTRQQELNVEAADLEETRQGLKEKHDAAREALAIQRKAHDETAEEINNYRVKLGQVDTNIENLIARSQDDLAMDLVGAFANYEHDDQRDWDQVRVRIEELTGKIQRLGNVNLDAIGEQEELEKRQEFLSTQLKDIAESRRQLNELIARINRESHELFVQTFELVRENFQELFRKLFGGGRADIMLTDPEDILESGIEIVARPPGKELRKLSLLSGGEKTMTALALLFSIFKARPSPFCLLDEVDAALDEANTERFGNLLSDFVQHSQFIVISHAKRTMSMANVLYGVTMQEPGVSKRISVRFEDSGSKLDTSLEPAAAT